MIDWNDINENSWSFTDDEITGFGGGIGQFQTSYAVNTKIGSKLNGKVSVDMKLSEVLPFGAGLVCRANNLWSFVAFYVAPSQSNSEIKMRLSIFQDGIFTPLAISIHPIILDDGFNHFSINFFSGYIEGKIITSKDSYSINHIVPQIPFPGQVGLIKFYETRVIAKHFKYEELQLSSAGGANSPQSHTHAFDVFISYSSMDKLIIEKLVQDFKNNGISFWVDYEQVSPVDRITEKIEEGLSKSRYLLACLSENYIKSKWIQAEYGAILNGILSNSDYSQRIIPLKLDRQENYATPLLLADIKKTSYYKMDEFDQLLKFLRS